MRALVLCGTGFIGRLVSIHLDTIGLEVAVLHRGLHHGNLPSRIRHIADPTAGIPLTRIPEAARRYRPDIVVHMVPLGAADAAACVEAFSGTARRLVAISSGDVYRAYGVLLGTEPIEPAPDPSQSEDAPLRTRLYPYGRDVSGPWGQLRDYDKILMERVVLDDPELPATILRLPKVYGPSDPQQTFGPYVRRLDDQRPAVVLGEAQAQWRWTHGYVENVAAAIALAATDERAVGRIYNLGEPQTPTLAERVVAVGVRTGWRGRVVSVPDHLLPPALSGPYRYTCDVALDTTRIRSELGYAEPVSQNEALDRTISWLRSNASREGLRDEYRVEDELLASIT